MRQVAWAHQVVVGLPWGNSLSQAAAASAASRAQSIRAECGVHSQPGAASHQSLPGLPCLAGKGPGAACSDPSEVICQELSVWRSLVPLTRSCHIKEWLV